MVALSGYTCTAPVFISLLTPTWEYLGVFKNPDAGAVRVLGFPSLIYIEFKALAKGSMPPLLTTLSASEVG